MEIFGPLLISSIAGLSTVLGSLVIFLKFKRENISKFIVFSLSFSLAIMIGISITDLIPESSYIILSNYNISRSIIICTTSFLIGVLLIFIINKLIKLEDTDNLYKLGILSMLALMIHNFPEGIATFMSSYQDLNLGIKLSIAIMLHNIPEGISIAVPIYYATNKKSEAVKKTLLSGLAEPLGAIIAYIFLYKYISYTLISIVLILVAGIMIALSINELLPKALKYHKNEFIIYGILCGVGVITLNLLIK